MGTAKEQSGQHHVVIVGGGFGGLNVALQLKSSSYRVTLIDQRNFHLFQPMLYQVATGLVSPSDIAVAIRKVVRKKKNVTVYNAKVMDIIPSEKKLVLADDEITYDTLVLATGVTHDYFGNDHWHDVAPGLKTIEESSDIRRRLLLALEAAERETNKQKQEAYLRFVIVGGGPTGVELAGSIAEGAHHTIAGQYRNFDHRTIKVILVEGADRILTPFHPSLSEKAKKSLEDLGVELRLNSFVTDVNKKGITIKTANGNEEFPCRTVLWAAGVKVSPLGMVLADKTGVELDRAGRVMVEPNCTVKGHDNIFVIGDMGHFRNEDGSMVPGVATTAIQQAGYVAKLLNKRYKGKELAKPFKYWDKGSLAIIGRTHAVGQVGKFKFSGLFAVLAWAFVHIFYLVDFGNRFFVGLQWTWYFFTRSRSVGLITGDDAYHLIEEDSPELQPPHENPEASEPPT